MRRPLRVAATMFALLAGGAVRAADAREAAEVKFPPAAAAQEVKLPQTAAEHQAMSRSYEEKATALRAEALYHRDMAREYTKSHPDRKSGARNPWAVEMEKHCAALVKDAEQHAADADDLARFHRLRAMELEGK